jgi:hypothetical protein
MSNVSMADWLSNTSEVTGDVIMDEAGKQMDLWIR